ncbi:MAG: phosphatase PAP2 family protein [Ignavibacteria bacterium]
MAYIILLCLCFIKGGKSGKIAVVGAVILIIFSDQLSSHFIKNWVARIRPCNVLPNTRVLDGYSGSYSFPSSHAVNNFAEFMFFSILYPRLRKILFTIAFLVSFSRIYVGRHYPSDVIGGAVLGCAVGYLFARIAIRINIFIQDKYLRIDTNYNSFD